MELFGGWRSMSGRMIFFIVLAAVYYVALNVVLIQEIIERVQAGPQPPVVAVQQSYASAEIGDSQDLSSSCSGLAKAERDTCRVELLVGKSVQAKGERRERRAVQERRPLAVQPALAGGLATVQ